MTEVRAGRPVAQVILVFLLAVLMGRLMLERTGVGQGLLFVAIPLAFVLLAALYGVRPAVVLLVLMLGLAWIVRFALTLGGWLIVLMIPIVLAVLAISTHVLVLLVRDRRAGAGPGASEEGEEE